MTGDQAAGSSENPVSPDPVSQDGGSFDARDRVTSLAFDLHAQATAESAIEGRHGFVPDAWLDGLGAGTADMVAELCKARVWERAEDGYRILDQDAVDRCRDLSRVLWADHARVRARIRDREHALAQDMPELAEAMVVAPPCAACGAAATRIELVAPGQLPVEWDQWPDAMRDSVSRQRGPGQWYLIVDGVAAGNGHGSEIGAGEAGRIAQAFRLPLSFARVRTAGFYDDAGFCDQCEVPYCSRHWHVSDSGYGTCPLGHGRSLDPHWSPAQD
jgi:hypothetical protein